MKLLPLLPVLAMLSAPAFASAPITGRWISEGGQSLVEIAPCGRTLCGRIAKVLKPDPGAPKTDVHNPDPKLRGRPIEGITILSGFVDDGRQWKGNIYDPRSGKLYDSKLNRAADGTLIVKGCVLFLCQGQSWTPAR